VSLKKGSAAEFLNVDLDLWADAGLEELLGYLAPTVLVLNRTATEATLELNQEYGSLEETAAGFIAVIRSLPPQAMRLWEHCELRRMNIGIQAGMQPHQSSFGLSKETVASLADIQAEVVFTLYAPHGTQSP
jgi:hypothetical protein